MATMTVRLSRADLESILSVYYETRMGLPVTEDGFFYEYSDSGSLTFVSVVMSDVESSGSGS